MAAILVSHLLACEGAPELARRMVLTKLSLVQCSGAVHMSNIINIHEAKTHLSRIVDEVAAGTEVIIAKAGKPLAKLSPISPSVKKKKLGLLKGKVKVPDDFNAPLPPEIIAGFEGPVLDRKSVV